MFKLISSEPTVSHTFLAIEGKVLKVILGLKSSEVYCADEFLGGIAEKALATGYISPPAAIVRVGEASEADLLAAQKTSPSKAVELEKLLAYRRAVKTPPVQPPPLQVEIVNPQEIARRDQVLRIQRDSNGLMQSATAHQV